ncbi:MAG: hypothetical protein JWO82_2683, partial [Akkermansiaceae bacterium]|nr:hypothetical protein [Akkermansiaceae bacterium]
MRLLATAAVLVAGGIGLGFIAGKGYRPTRKAVSTSKPSAEAKPDGPDADLLKSAEEKYEIELAAKDQEIARLRGQAGGSGKGPGSSEDGGELPPV